MIVQTGPARPIYGGGRRGLGDESITVTGTAEPIPYDYADISTAPVLTYSGDSPNVTDLSNYMSWITGATPAPSSPVFFPSSSSSGGAVSALTSLAAQVANLFRPTGAAAPSSSAAQASAAASASTASWFSANRGLVIGGGLGLVALLVLMRRR